MTTHDASNAYPTSDPPEQASTPAHLTEGDLPLDLQRDPLRVLESTRPLMLHAQHVGIDRDALERTADQILSSPPPLLDWRHDLHPVSADPHEQATLVLVLDALNFCFWQLPASGQRRWQVSWDGSTYDGYWALAVALRRAIEQGYPLSDAAFLASISEDDVAAIFAPDPGSDAIPLLHARMLHLHEVGHALLERWNGSFLTAIHQAHGSATHLLQSLLRALPCFRDVAILERRELHFYKRAQILIADLVGAFHGSGPGTFDDLHVLTAFADYKVPQVLRRLGVLTYSPALAAHLQRRDLLPLDSREELEIRAGTVWGVELLRQALAARGRDLAACELDGMLWHAGQTLPGDAEPYHRTLTVWY